LKEYEDQMNEKRIIAVAMSGGVDSSVAAAQLVERGEQVFGIMLRLWSDPNHPNRCCSPADMTTARNIANHLEIPFYAIDAQKVFKEKVVDYFIDGYSKGITPNPCIECNRLIRWDFLYRKAFALGATHLATGHYAKVAWYAGKFHLLRGKDVVKDQSYVLSILNQDRLAHAIFPLSDLTKEEVRKYARKFSFAIADREESQDLCFIGNGNYHDFLQQQNVPLPPVGPIMDIDNNVLGEHKGLAAYTIGQRKGIGISMPYPLYVIQKNIEDNTLIVGPKDQLGRVEFVVDRMNWILGSPPSISENLQVQVRYRAPKTPVTVQPMGKEGARVKLEKSLPDVTPGQFAVFYSGEECLGGGIIQP
jgi:tRNA-specific 2-thiouridylase